MVLQAAAGFIQFTLSGVRVTLSTLGALPFRFQFIGVWFLLILFLLFNATSIYGEDAQRQTTLLLLYMVSLAFVFSQTRNPNPLLTTSAAEFFITFTLWVVLGAVLFKFIQPFNPERALLTSESIALLVTHALVVAISEELLFRHRIPGLIPGPAIAGQTLSALAFGFMHYSAYGGDLASLLFASVLGLLFGAITIRFRNGLIIAIALHFTWNAYTLGFI